MIDFGIFFHSDVDTDTSEVLLDLLWADPSTNHEEDTVDHDDRFPDGFAPNNTRGTPYNKRIACCLSFLT